MKYFTLSVLAMLLAAGMAGCSPQEKQGLSPLPQNQPQNWEINPYGDMRN